MKSPEIIPNAGTKNFLDKCQFNDTDALFSIEKFSSRCDSKVNINITETVRKRQTA